MFSSTQHLYLLLLCWLLFCV